MDFYAYKGKLELGREKLGTDDNMIIRNLKTEKGAFRRCSRRWPDGNFRIYSFTNFHNDKTFKEIKH